MKSKFLMSLSLAGIITFAIGTQAFAATSGYLVKDSSTVYEFNKTELSKGFLNYKRTGSDVLYSKYNELVQKSGLYALYDDTGKYVSYDAIKTAFLNAKRTNVAFNLDNFTESTSNVITNMPSVIKGVKVSGTSIVYEDKKTGSETTPGETEDLEVVDIY